MATGALARARRARADASTAPRFGRLSTTQVYRNRAASASLRRCVRCGWRTHARYVDVDRQPDPAVCARDVQQSLPDGGEGMPDVGRCLGHVEDARLSGDPEGRLGRVTRGAENFDDVVVDLLG